MLREVHDFPENILNLGCGEDQNQIFHNVDINESVDPDEVVDLESLPWPWPDECVAEITAHHIFEHFSDIEAALHECKRLLEPGGRLIVTVPAGMNADADPDHTWGKNGRPWTWQTPEFYCGERHWDTDVGLRVVDKSVTLHTHYGLWPLKALHHFKWGWERLRHGDGEWAFNQPASSGEFRVVFEKP